MPNILRTSRRLSLGPVVFDLDGDGIEYTSFLTSTVRFDMDNDGDLDRTSWVGADDGLLVFDRNGNGLADNGSEISFQSLVAGAASDLEGLAFFDTNNDKILDSSDAEFSKFRVWRDANQNGITDAGELRTLAEAGITAIDLEGERTGRTPDGRDTVTFATSAYLRPDGSTRAVADTFFVFEPSDEIIPPPTGSGTDPVTPPAIKPPPVLALTSQVLDRKAKKYSLEAKNGSLYVNARKNKQIVDTRAGSIGPAIILDFKNKHIGMLSPIILDLDGDGLDLESMKKSKARFDMDGDGIADDTGWVGRGDGMLVIDRNKDGLITGASEISFLTEKTGAKSDLDGLSVLDSNKDGKIDARDIRFGELKIWVDANRNGITDEGELKTLTEHGITEISLASKPNQQTAKIGENIVVATTTFTRANGTTGTVGDVALAFNPSSRNPRGADAQLSALRRGIIDGFDGFNGTQEAAFSNIEQLPLPAPSLADQQIGQIVQAMAVFGARSGQNDLTLRASGDTARYDFAAVS